MLIYGRRLVAFATLRCYCSTTVREEFAQPKPIFSTKPRSEIGEPFDFIDYRSIVCKAGDGGNGLISFLREKDAPFMGPDGGDGGNGGHIILHADRKTRDLSSVRRTIQAPNGAHGLPKVCDGRSADHVYVKVPLGTMVKATDSNEIISELTVNEQIFVAARGGCGGHGNHYYLSNKLRAPQKAEIGGVEMRLLAHAGLVGFPNAGKSTFLRAISRARPKVAFYPFTTIKPHIGIVHYDDFEQIAVADLPGLITDAHRNRGLGLDFLRHIERCLCLLFILDYTLGDFSAQYSQLCCELDAYSDRLSSHTSAIIINKYDLADADSRRRHEWSDLRPPSNVPIFHVSAKYRQGIDPVLMHIRRVYDDYLMTNQQ